MTELSPLGKKLSGHKLILGSGSPRRRLFLEQMGLPFEVRVQSVEEIYPENLRGKEISDYLAKLKASPFLDTLLPNEIVLTSDTVVWHKGESLAKAINKKEAFAMLDKLSGDWHEVITSVCFTTNTEQKTVNVTTKVRFKEFTDEEINHYIDCFEPFDKAGAYGIQEWIGMIGILEIQGSYTNVVGLPTHLVYKTLMDMVS